MTRLDEQIKAEISNSHGYLTADKLATQIRSGWRVRDMVPRKGLCVVWGPPGSGKSFFVLDLACAIARGMPAYHGKRVRPGIVIYMAMEGNLQDRVGAYMVHNAIGQGDLECLLVKHGSIDFMHRESVEAECAAIRDIVGEQEVALVVVDTLARSMPGGNENSSDAMGLVIGGYKVVEDYFGCCVMPLHHCGKAVENGMRGHSSLLGAIDAEIEIRRVGDDLVRTIHVGKQKDGQDHYDLFNFRLERIELGPTSRWDEDADPEEMDSSCVLVKTDDEAMRPALRAKKSSSVFDRALQMAQETRGDISKESVRICFYALYPNPSPDAKAKAFNRAWNEWMSATCRAINSDGRTTDIS